VSLEEVEPACTPEAAIGLGQPVAPEALSAAGVAWVADEPETKPQVEAEAVEVEDLEVSAAVDADASAAAVISYCNVVLLDDECAATEAETASGALCAAPAVSLPGALEVVAVRGTTELAPLFGDAG
jgi:hypothetical protein